MDAEPDRNDGARPRTGDLKWLFEPRTIAIVGASDDAKKFGGRVLELLRRYEFAGEVFPVNARLADDGADGFYRSVAEVDASVDLAVIAIPAAAAVEALEECLEDGAKSAVIFAGGFAETTADGARLQARIAELSKRFGAPVVGPNSQGVANFATGAIANFSSAMLGPRVDPGPVTILSQSGLVGAVVLDELRRRGVGVGALLATGNEAALSVDDAMGFVAEERPDTALLVCLESVKNPEGFREALRRSRANSVDVAVLKIGRYTAGQRAARSHTAAIASDAAVFDAVCRDAGVLQVDTIAELADVGMALAPRTHQRYGARVAIVSNSGGVSGLVADRAQHFGFSVPEFSDELRQRLDALVPDFIEANNPLDVSTLSYQDAEGFGRVLAEIAGSEEVDQLHIHLGFPYWNVERTADAIGDVEDRWGLPVLTTSLGSKEVLLDELRARGRKTFTEPDALIGLARRLVDHGDRDTRELPPPESEPLAGRPPIDVGELRLSHSDVVLGRMDALGVSAPRTRVASTAEGAEGAAAELGFPVVVKLLSESLVHKSDVGGVRVGLRTAGEVETAAAELLELSPAEEHPRLLLQEQVSGTELLLAVHRDPQFGTVVILGSGGVYVEVLRDTAILVPPISRTKVEAALRRLRVSHLLEAHRGVDAIAIGAIVRSATGLLHLWEELPDAVTTFEVNPLIVGRGSKGHAWAVDYRAEIVT